MKRISQECVYCGVNPGTTNDHVPPNQMFPDPKPSNLITVPACPQCNGGFQKDEEYFRGLFALTGATIEQEAPEFWEKVCRGLERSPGLKKTINDSLRAGTMVNPDGVEVGRWMTIEDNIERIVNLIAKCVRGLYFFEMSTPMSPSVPITCHLSRDEVVDLGTLYRITRQGKRSWPGVFEYRYTIEGDDPTTSAWIFTFYSTCVYTAYSGTDTDWMQQNKKNTAYG